MNQEQINAFASILDYVITRNEVDIAKERQRRATRTTAEYVDSKLRNVTSVDSVDKVHDVALNNIDFSLKDGLVLELGVYGGSTINYLAKKLPEKQIHGFDSFEGLPEFWRDGFAEGHFKLNSLPSVESNVKLYKGWFEETLPIFFEQEGMDSYITYMHIDSDLYSSANTIFKCAASKIKKGTIIVFDEYFNYPGWQYGEFKAFKEFIEYSGLSYDYITYNRLHEQVAVKIK
jgi:hypothetical protein